MKKTVFGILLLILLVSSQIVLADGTLIYGDGNGITRAEWLHDLVVMFNMQVEEGNGPEDYFHDVDSSHEYYDDILKAVEFGVVDIPAGGDMLPDSLVTRMFAVSTLNYCLGYEIDTYQNYSFSDAANIQDPDAAQFAYDKGWFSLVDGQFQPARAVTADEIRNMEESVKTTLSASVLDPDYENTYTFQSGVFVLPKTVSVIMESDTELIIEDSSYYGNLQNGQVFIFWMNDIPQAFVPSNITLSDGNLIVTGTFQEDSSAIEEMDAQGEVDADMAQFQAADDVDITWYEGGTAAKLYTDGREITSRTEAKNVVNLKALKATKTFEIESGVKTTVSVYLEGMKLEYKANIFTQYAYVDLKGLATVSGQISVDVVKMTGNSGRIFMGRMPIFGVGSVDIYLVYGLDGKLTVTYTANFETGFEYDRGTRRGILSFKKKNYTMETQINAKLGVRMDAGIDLALIKGGVYAETGAKAEYKSKDWNDGMAPAICRSLKAWIYAMAGYNAKVFGKEVVNENVTIFDYDNSPVRMNFHWEDGSWVPVCSRDPKETYFTTKWNSRFGGLGLGYGFDEEGNWVPVFTFDVLENEKMEKVAEITGYTGSAYALTIPETVSDENGEYKVTSIGSNAFRNRSDIHIINFPSTLLKVNDHAFFGCSSLEQVLFPDDVTEIGAFAFAKCTNLSRLELPKNVNKICGGAFAMTDHLTQVTIPKNLKETTSEYDYSVKYDYHYGVFMESKGLKSVTFEAGTTKVINGLFANTPGLESITIPEGVTRIESDAFKSCENLKEVNLPATLTFIGGNAFYDNNSLPLINIPDTVTEIGPFAFAKCDVLSQVHLPDKLTKISGGAFGACDALTSIEIPANIRETTKEYDPSVLYDYHYGVFMQCQNLNNITFREGIVKIPDGLFANTIGLKTITIPDTVTEIGNNAFETCKYLEEINFSKNLAIINKEAFYNCSSLKTLEFPDSVRQIYSFAFAFASSLESLTLPKYVNRIDGGAFGKCDNLDTVTIPKTLKTSEQAYHPGVHYGYEPGIFLEGMGPKKIIFEEGTEVIQRRAFGFSRGLEEVVLPSTLTQIIEGAFTDCNKLKNISLPKSLTYMGWDVFYNCSSLETITIPEGITKLEDRTFAYCSSLKDVKLPDTLTRIGKEVFRECALPGIDLPDSLTYIGESAFRSNASLEEITIPASVQSIGKWCFRECTSLANVKMNIGLEEIGQSAFLSCKALEEIEIPDSVLYMGPWALSECDNLVSVRLSEGLTEISKGLLSDDPKLKEVKIPYRVTTIGEEAFQNDYSLSQITMLDKVQSVGNNAISYPGSTTIYGISGTYAETYANENYINFVPLGDVPVTGITATPDELTLTTNGNQYERRITLTIDPMDFTSDVTWEIISGSDVIRLSDDGSGLVTGRKAGSAEIRITAGDKSVTVPVTVVQLVTRITINDAPEEMNTGENAQLAVSIRPDDASNKTVEWSSSAPEILSVDENGLVTALKAGKAVITAAATDGSGKKASCEITVNEAPLTSEVMIKDPNGEDITGKSISVANTTYQLTAAAEPSTALQSFNWSSSDENIAVVDNTGCVTFSVTGTVTITAEAADGSGMSASVELEYEGSSKSGDLDADGEVGISDLILFIHILLDDPVEVVGTTDFDNNGSVDMGDLIILIHLILGDPIN